MPKDTYSFIEGNDGANFGLTKLKSLKYILVMLFAFQGIWMSGAMAAGNMPGMPKASADSGLLEGATESFQAGLSELFLKEKENPAHNQEMPFPKDASCCSIDCGCTSLFIMTMPSMPTLQPETEHTFNLVFLIKSRSFALPDPPRTTFI